MIAFRSEGIFLMENRFEREGQHIGDYHLLRGLGKGGFGDVYLGEHIPDHTQAAVKILRTQLTHSGELKEFINEARTFRLKHPHIVSLLDFGIADDDAPFLVMDYAPYGSLRDRHPKGSQLPLSTIVPYVTAIASALQYAHNHHLIHRDVKPENMLIGPHQEILLSDFGIAAVAQSTRALVTDKGIGGTLPYMAPEQILGKPRPASDQYALGIIVYEWLCGSRPFNGTLPELIVMHQNAPPPSLSEQVPTLPIEVEQVVLKALAKDPKQRFAHVQEFAIALEEASKKEGTIASITPIASSDHSSQVVTFQTLHPPLPVQQLEEQVNTNAPILSEAPFVIPTPTPPHAVEMTPSITLPPNATFPPPVVAQGAAVPSPQQMQYSFQGQRGTFETRRIPQISASRKIVLFVLVLVLLIGASVAVVYTTRKIATDNAQTTATTQVRATATTRAGPIVTAQAHATATAQKVAIDAYNQAAAINGVMFGFNPQHTHANPYERILSPTTVSALTKKWTFPTRGSIESSSPAVVNGVVYIGSNDSNLYAIDAASGTKKWAYSIQIFLESSSPAVVNGIVYVGSGDGNLYAIDTASGTQKWAYQTGGPIGSSPAVVNGVVYVGSTDSNLYAFHLPNAPEEQ
jgi:serine/threonine protein kinase